MSYTSKKSDYVPKKGEDCIVPLSYRIASNGRRVTRGLFYEVKMGSEWNFFTMGPKDIPEDSEYKAGLLSFPKLYMSYCVDDPTEYTMAKEVFGSWEHWQMIVDCNDLKPYIEALRKEAVVAIRAKALAHIANEVKDKTKNAYAAAKWLAEKGWEPQESASEVKAKRKSKAEKEAQEQEDAKVLEVAKDLFDELGISRPN